MKSKTIFLYNVFYNYYIYKKNIFKLRNKPIVIINKNQIFFF